MTITAQALLEPIVAHIQQSLVPAVEDIDQKGVYPREFMHQLGALGGFASAVSKENGGLGLTLSEQIAVTSAVAESCGSTAFVVWCQSVSAYYLQHAPNTGVQQRFLSKVAKGELLCGTGMSNAVKHLAGIERIHLQAKRTDNGYEIKGVLPWVSNLQHGNLIIAAAALEDGGYVMFAAPLDSTNLELHCCPDFSGMQGTATYNVRFHGVQLDNDSVLAHPEQFVDYIASIKPGFVISQIGMGAGIIKTSIHSIEQTNKTHSHVNQFLDNQGEDLQQELDSLLAEVQRLVPQIHNGTVNCLDVLKARAAASELSLKAVNSEALHTGAKGYLMRHGAQRRLREALFVAIVTPALKHLRKEIHSLEQLAEAS